MCRLQSPSRVSFRFAVGHQHLQFTCLPFRLSTPPPIFSKVLLKAVALIGRRGIRLHHYLDDLLLLSRFSRSLAGWLVNQEKSHLSPTQSLNLSRGPVPHGPKHYLPANIKVSVNPEQDFPGPLGLPSLGIPVPNDHIYHGLHGSNGQLGFMEDAPFSEGDFSAVEVERQESVDSHLSIDEEEYSMVSIDEEPAQLPFDCSHQLDYDYS